MRGTVPPLASFHPVNHHERGHQHHPPYPHANHPLGPVTLPRVQGKLAREELDE
jgi:sirohydrochlorin cobaltochelatase